MLYLYEFCNYKGHQGLARAFNMLKWKFWWKGIRLDIKRYINSCITCSENLPHTAHHPTTALRNTQVPFICIAIDTFSKLPTTSSGNKYTLPCMDLLTSYIIAVPMPNKLLSLWWKLIFEVFFQGQVHPWYVCQTMDLNWKTVKWILY